MTVAQARTRAFSLAVALASCATIALELGLTRIYSVTMYYHFAFMVISLALLGLATAGVTTYLLPRLFRDERAALVAALAMLGFALTSLVALWVSLRTTVSLRGWSGNTSRLVLLYAAASLPFLCSGFALTVAIAAARERIGRIYAYDLVGAGLGCILLIPMLSRLGGPGAIAAVAALGAASAIGFALAAGRRGCAGIAALGCAVAAFLAVTEPAAHRFGLARNAEKFLGTRRVELERWNAFSQITVAPAGANDHKWIFIDADAATRVWSGDATNDAMRRIPEIRLAALVYALRKQGPALVIGPGGGTDVRSALAADVPRVVGVEVNPIIVSDIMRNRYADYSGRLYSDPRVHMVVDEGRSYVRRSDTAYSSIQATLVDTWAASSSGAFTLSENNLYTVEAFEEFLAHLAPHGVLAVTRWYDRGAPSEFLRLVALGRAALERRGAPDPAAHFILLTDNERRATVLVSRDPFTPDDLATARARAQEDRLTLLYLPGEPRGDSLLGGFLRAPSAAGYLAQLPYDAAPTVDDRPFFFYSLKRGKLWSLLGRAGGLERNNLGIAILVLLLALSAGVTAVFVLLPLLAFRREALRERRLCKLRVLVYFLCLGTGFILIEIGFMQRFVLFLGHPIYALAVVLATLLVSSGVGSALSTRGAARFGLRGFARRTVVALVALLVGYGLALSPLFHALIGMALPARVALAVPLVAAPGLLMGMLLPTGVRAASGLGAEVVPWAWGLNGAGSVVGSIAAILLSMNYGFTAALAIGIAIYAVAALVLPPSPAADAQRVSLTA
jgi:spermidine synthase